MKRILSVSFALAGLTALSACSPYSWQKDYGTNVVNLDGPVRKHVTYVPGATSFGGIAPQNARTANVIQQAPVQFTQPQVQMVQPQVIQAPLVQAPIVQAPIVRAPVAVPNVAISGAAAAPTLRVPPAFINGGQAANLQTRRVGDKGVVVFSNMIEDAMAASAATRSCSGEGKTAQTSGATEVAVGVKQMNFTCG